MARRARSRRRKRGSVAAPRKDIVGWVYTDPDGTPTAPADVSRTAGPEPAFPIACMTYQSLCQLDDPEAAIRQIAAARWATDRAAAIGVEVDDALREG